MHITNRKVNAYNWKFPIHKPLTSAILQNETSSADKELSP